MDLRALLDTNVLVRHLTHDPPATGARATRFLTEADGSQLTDLIAAECVFVLESYYGWKPRQLADVMASAIGMESIEVDDERVLLRTLELYGAGTLDFPEAYLAARSERGDACWIASFDRTLDRVPSIRRLEP